MSHFYRLPIPLSVPWPADFSQRKKAVFCFDEDVSDEFFGVGCSFFKPEVILVQDFNDLDFVFKEQ